MAKMTIAYASPGITSPRHCPNFESFDTKNPHEAHKLLRYVALGPLQLHYDTRQRLPKASIDPLEVLSQNE